MAADAHDSVEPTVEDRVLRIVVDILAAEPERSVPEAYLVQDLGADSLDFVWIEFDLEDAFGLVFTDAESEQLHRCINIADVGRLVRSMLDSRAEARESR